MLTHKCSSGRIEVSIIKSDEGYINIVRGVENSFTENLVANITYCPFCGVNLKEITKVG